MTTDIFVFEPPLRGSWGRASRGMQIANHEAGHAVVAVLLGLDVYEARVDRPDTSSDGVVSVRSDFDRSREHLLATLAGPLLAPLPASPVPAWPPSLDAFGDEQNAAILVERLGFCEEDWDEAIAETRSILCEVPRAITDVSGALLERGALRGDELRDIVTSAVVASVGGRPVRR